MIIGRAKFKNKLLFEEYIKRFHKEYKEIRNKINKLRSESQLTNEEFKVIESCIDKYFRGFFDDEHYKRELSKDMQLVYSYISSMETSFELLFEIDEFAVIKYGKYTFIVDNSDDYLVKEYIKDYSNTSLAEFKNYALSGSTENPLSIMIPEDNTTIKEIENKQQGLKEQLEEFDKKINDVQNEYAPELKELKEKMEKLQREMDEKKNELMNQLNEKKVQLYEMKAKLERKLRVLEDSIYTIRCYMGETIELIKIRTGKPADKERPLIINKKLKYLDEDLAQLASIYIEDLDGGRYSIFEELLKYNDLALEYFCPYERCISFFRVSKENRGIYFENNITILKNYEVLHGDRIGFLIRDGENLFISYTEEDRVIVEEDVFLKATTEQIKEGDREIQSRYSEFASRMFIFSILQGLFEKGEVLQFPIKLNVFSSFDNNPYIKWSYAENWVSDNRYGDFASISDRLNKRNMVGDEILTIVRAIEETSDIRRENTRGREDSEVNRTYDCTLKSGVHKINLIDKEIVYVSVKKRYSESGATSNFRVNEGEYVNLTYMNSDWLRYYIINKQVGNFRIGNGRLNYAYIVKYLKMALEHLEKREVHERTLILEHYPELDKIKEWRVILSNWKLLFDVRYINSFQAKRFSKYLSKGEVFVKKHLYDKEYYNAPSSGINSINKTHVKGYMLNMYSSNSDILKKDVTDEEIEAQFIKDKEKVESAYRYVLNRAKECGYSYKEVIRRNRDIKHEKFLDLIKDDFSYSDNIKLFESKLGVDAECIRNKENHMKFFKFSWSNYMVELYKHIYSLIEELEDHKFEHEYEIIPLAKFI